VEGDLSLAKIEVDVPFECRLLIFSRVCGYCEKRGCADAVRWEVELIVVVRARILEFVVGKGIEGSEEQTVLKPLQPSMAVGRSGGSSGTRNDKTCSFSSCDERICGQIENKNYWIM
jgi:hypothetical protein